MSMKSATIKVKANGQAKQKVNPAKKSSKEINPTEAHRSSPRPAT
jgi:hypothetical protein